MTRLTARSADVKMLVSSFTTQHRSGAIRALAAAVALSITAPLSAQAPNPAGANATTYHVAVVDISYIFKNHARFKAAVESFRKEMEASEVQLKAEREKIAQLENERNQLQAGSPDYKQRDEEVARQMAELQLKVTKVRKDLMEREGKIYYQTYLEVVDAVKYYAKRQNIGLVLRFNGEKVDPTRRDEVLREINKDVVVQDQIDITPDILALLNRDQQGAPSTPQNPSTARQQQLPSQLPR
jgi:Skp family chaperone for outer membrane proteins